MQFVYGSIALLCVCVLTFNSVDARSMGAYVDNDESSEMERRDLYEALTDALLARSSRHFLKSGARKRQGGSGSGSGSGDLGSGSGNLGSGSGNLGSGSGNLGSGSGDLGSGFGDLGSGFGDLGSLFGGYSSGWEMLASLLGGSGSGFSKRRHFNPVANYKRQKQYYHKRNYDGGYNGDLED
ncbi:unnamed protein product [Adineta ricciae]|uniref:Uncharacterized protein n=1 Tax=Adineta ricciae TaxID=249248 RepID=A0A815MQK7_ADIRI|nr:unnamed protein product [Adineta ricciae]CAF1424710.1 unnamed protein product [Adineta ricciae]